MPDPKDTAAHVKSLASATPTPAPKPPTVAEPAPPPVVTPLVGILDVQGTVYSKGGNNSVSFRAPNPTIFSSPDAAIVITNLQQAIFDQVLMGRAYKIEISLIP
jgi:hypothetical protein